jgi:hypothetical protein
MDLFALAAKRKPHATLHCRRQSKASQYTTQAEVTCNMPARATPPNPACPIEALHGMPNSLA